MKQNWSLVEKVKIFVERELMIAHDSKFLLAVSGGLDSMVLLDVMVSLGYYCQVAHCNFSLRGSESDEDEKLVQQVTQQYQLKYHNIRFDTQMYAHQHKLSTQMAARILRYDWFEKIRIEHSLDWLLTAHHSNDQLETVLYNVAKGGGIAGMRGIPPIRDRILRPLLCCTKDEIYNFATEHRLKWREDSSNDTDYYQRNYIRKHIVPAMHHINPAVVEMVAKNSKKIRLTEILLAESISYWRAQLLHESDERNIINFKKIEKHPAREYILYELIKPYEFNFEHAETIFAPRNTISGKILRSGTYELLMDRNKLIITKLVAAKINSSDDSLILPIASKDIPFGNSIISMSVLTRGAWSLEKDSFTFQGDYAKLREPIQIGYWQQGDSIQPLGMKGKKKISDLMIDAKIPLNLKSKQLILRCGDEIIWAVGLRVANQVKITNDTKEVLVIKIRNKNDQSV